LDLFAGLASFCHEHCIQVAIVSAIQLTHIDELEEVALVPSCKALLQQLVQLGLIIICELVRDFFFAPFLSIAFVFNP